MLDIILETLLDGLKLVPFLFLTFLIIELLEHKANKKSLEVIKKSGKFGPIVGSLLGVIPQCGFSVMATNLYVARVVSLGTLIAIYLSTSDEMLPILLSEQASISTIFLLVGIKFFIGLIMGIIIDIIYRKKKEDSFNYEICDHDHCHCNDGILIPVIKHTINILLFILLISFIINILFETFSEEILSKIFLKNSIFGPFLASLIGLIPNCGASVMITELFLNNAISLGSTIAGLLTGSGVAILVLFKINKNIKENIVILSLVYSIGVISGILIDLIANML